MRIIRIEGREVTLSGGVRFYAPGPVALGRVFQGVAVLLLGMPSGDDLEDFPGCGFDNVFGYAADGRCLWRVEHPKRFPSFVRYEPYFPPLRRPVLLAGLALEVELDPATGRHVRAWPVGQGPRAAHASRHRGGSGVLATSLDRRWPVPQPWEHLLNPLLPSP